MLLDAVVAVTDTPRSLPRWANGTKAVAYFNRVPDSTTGDRVLDTFGQSARGSVCACDTKTDPSLSQVMHFLVGDTAGPRVHTAATSGVLKKIIDDHSTPEHVVEAIFIRVLSRRPTSDEMAAMLKIVAENKPPAVYEDIFAGLLNSSEFMFNH